MTSQPDEPIYVGIENTTEIRRALLESSKILIHILQANEKLKAQKARKHELVIQLKEKIRETIHLVAHLKTVMPKIRLSSLPKKARPEPIHAPNPAREQKETPKELPKPKPMPRLSETEKLERELKEIEEKLSRL